MCHSLVLTTPESLAAVVRCINLRVIGMCPVCDQGVHYIGMCGSRREAVQQV